MCCGVLLCVQQRCVTSGEGGGAKLHCAAGSGLFWTALLPTAMPPPALLLTVLCCYTPSLLQLRTVPTLPRDRDSLGSSNAIL